MKTIYFLKRIFLFLFCATLILPVNADELGRLFTTQSERAKLEKIRYAKPKPEVVEEIEIEEIIEPIVEEEKVVRDVITVRGLVHRSDGKNTAWINSSNTYEGDLESQYIEVSSEQISTEDVTIVMPDNETKIKIKVGDSFDPESQDEN